MSNLNLNKYTDQAAYNADTRPANENCVSLVGQDVVYDGVNLILKRNQLKRDDVCLVFWDNTDSDYVFIPIETYVASKLDTTRYTVQNYVRFTRSLGRDVVMHKDVSAGMVAEYNRYKLVCDTTASGGFHWTVNVNYSTKSGNVTWAAGDTLDSIVTQLNTGAVATYLVFTHENNENFIRIRTAGHPQTTFTLSSNTGATLTDLSLYTKIGNIQQAESHRTWQSTPASTLFPNIGFIEPTTAQYARNGYNLSYYCGGNLARYKAYYTSNGASSYVAESSAASRMKPSAFAALNGSGVAEQQALYDKYNGSWDAYMEASMVKIDDTHTDGIEYKSYANGDTQSQLLASITTMDYDGSYIPAYPAAYNAAQKTDTRGVITKWNMPTNHEIAVFMEDATYAKINTAKVAIGGTQLSNTTSYRSVAMAGDGYAWFYGGNQGWIPTTGLFYSFYLHPIAYLD